jgi:aminoglycoside phosphotransferase (APT) family kinase protein
VVWPGAPGAPLSWWLRRDPRAAATRLAEAGALLRAIHDARPDRAPAGLPAGPPLEAELAAITRTARHIGVLLPPVGRRVAEIMARSGDRLAGCTGEPPTVVHGDYKADHLLAGPDGLTLIDLDRCAWSDPALDLAKFLADLCWCSRTSGAAGAAALRARFLAGYGACPDERLARLQALEPLLLVKMAARRPRLHDPRWAGLTTALVAEADRLSAERVASKAVA